MPGYSQDQLNRARQPFHGEQDRNDAVAVLGHLLTEQRDGHSDDRATAIRTITAAVQNFDTRAALGAPASSFAEPSGLPAVASVVPPPRPSPTPLSPTPPPATPARPSASVTLQDGSVAASRASMERELKRVGLAASDGSAGKIDVLGVSPSSSMTRELKRAGLIPR
ncbi:hypothetical protein [Methylobacterium sp. Leaf91]|uniref:hypothetical protein n=1 Tax=Methylobacterium sp. Leaf91 TaxID=1736247 RepID=UPI000AD45650|nr:hypothetical protein [Methylobacterium sp. Leaf91]